MPRTPLQGEPTALPSPGWISGTGKAGEVRERRDGKERASGKEVNGEKGGEKRRMGQREGRKKEKRKKGREGRNFVHL